MNNKENLINLRIKMQENNIDTYILTGFDPHLSEYKTAHYNTVKFISGFTGSNGTVVITKDTANLWTDGRYFIQANNELDNDTFTLQKIGHKNTPTYINFACDNTPNNGTIALDGKTISTKDFNTISKLLSLKSLTLNTELDLISPLWTSRPTITNNIVFEHTLNFSGVSTTDKIKSIREKLKEKNCDLTAINVLEDIAWIFNLRGSDSSECPIFNSYAIVSLTDVVLFIDESKIINVKNYLSKLNITIKPYNYIYEYLKNLNDVNIFLKPSILNYSIFKNCKNLNIVNSDTNISEDLKASKNEVEIENIKKSTIRDCVALVKSIKYIKENIQNQISEFDVTGILTKYRSLQPNYLAPSFETICAYNSNGAMLHYSAKKNDCSIIKPSGFLLIDSGGQYLDGTTDITRTISLGNLTEEMKKDFTLVLKSVIAVSTATFIENVQGAKIDMLARIPMWNAGMDYKCGTGHGLGYVLNVHEGPSGIGSTLSPIRLNMLLTNEPGVYKEGQYGIRTENTMLVSKSFESFGDTFCKFDTVTFFPIDLDAIDKHLLTESELTWINDYHKKTFDTLSPYLNDDEVAWLKNETKAI